MLAVATFCEYYTSLIFLINFLYSSGWLLYLKTESFIRSLSLLLNLECAVKKSIVIAKYFFLFVDVFCGKMNALHFTSLHFTSLLKLSARNSAEPFKRVLGWDFSTLVACCPP